MENSDVTDTLHAGTCPQTDRQLIWTQLPWWTLLQNWACRHVRSRECYSAPSSSETGDQDLFRGKLHRMSSVSLTRPKDHSLLHQSLVAPQICFLRKLIKWHRQKWLIKTAFWRFKATGTLEGICNHDILFRWENPLDIYNLKIWDLHLNILFYGDRSTRSAPTKNRVKTDWRLHLSNYLRRRVFGYSSMFFDRKVLVLSMIQLFEIFLSILPYLLNRTDQLMETLAVGLGYTST